MELAFGIPGLIQVTAHIVKTIICITSTASTTSALAIRLRATFTGLHHILNQLETHYDVEAQQRMAVHVADVLEVIQAVEGKIEKWTEKSEEDGGGGHGGSSSKTKWSTGAARKTGEKAKAFVRWLKGEKEEVEGLLEELALRRDVLGMAMR